MGNLELAMEDCPKDAAYRDNLFEAMDAAHRSAEISGLMLTYLGQGAGRIIKSASELDYPPFALVRSAGKHDAVLMLQLVKLPRKER
jgi:hypothetical protein